jgi:histidyl-tRNA synthetase
LKDKNNNQLVLRYDLTVPLARVMSMYPQIPRPFKRYQIAPSFRDDKPDKGHFREFIQCDADVVGTSDLVADAEVIIMAATGLDRLGFRSYKIRVNHRDILRNIAQYTCGAGCDVLKFQRSLDFADKTLKQGVKGIKRDLVQKGFDQDSIKHLIPILQLNGDPKKVLGTVSSILRKSGFMSKGIDELYKILGYLPKNIYKKVEIDFTLARGADYYTGFILEGVIPDIPVGAVLGGGRYDNLIEAAGGKSEPAVGMAFGLERILTAMDELSMSDNYVRAILLIYGLDKAKVIKYAHHLRNAGVMVDFNPNISEFSEAQKYAQIHNYPAFAECNGHGVVVTKLKKGQSLFFKKIRKALHV